jgi:hypothetical protein
MQIFVKTRECPAGPAARARVHVLPGFPSKPW